MGSSRGAVGVQSGYSRGAVGVQSGVHSESTQNPLRVQSGSNSWGPVGVRLGSTLGSVKVQLGSGWGLLGSVRVVKLRLRVFLDYFKPSRRLGG